MSMHLTLYSYFRSSSAYRVRIALHWKGLEFAYRAVHLLEDGGQQHKDAYLSHNPMAELPALVIERDGQPAVSLGQSVAILEFLEESFPTPALFPQDPFQKARVRQIVEIVNSSIHPVQNLKVMQQLKAQFGIERPAALSWCKYFIERGFRGLERVLSETAGTYAVGDEISLADVALVPQCFNARRFGVDMDAFPTISRVDQAACTLEAFQKAAPERQPDTPEELRAP